MINSLLEALSCISLGIYAGSMLTEGAVMVPQWKALKPNDFFELHKKFGHRLYRYFTPITVLAVLFPQIVFVTACFTNVNKTLPLLVAFLMLICLATFYLYFKTANQKFATRGLQDSELKDELDRWYKIHWFRTIISLLAFFIAVFSFSY